MKTRDSIIYILGVKASCLERLQRELRSGKVKQCESITLHREKTKSQCEALLYVLGTYESNVYECGQDLIERLKLLGIAHEAAKGTIKGDLK